jgi:hypothetical protein
MAYYGTTQLSSIANPPVQLAKGLGGLANTTASSIGGTGLWLYSSSNSATEASSGTNSGTFFTDAYYLGMKSGDVMMMVCSTGSSVGFAIGVIGGVSTAGAYMSTGSQTNSTAGA